jgi:hypothetical protein
MKFILFIVFIIGVFIVLSYKTPNANSTLKIHVYHMPNCGHCYNLMYNTKNGDPPFTQLKNIYKTNKDVYIKDFLYGRDEEAKKYTAFPVILFVTKNGETEYTGPYEATKIAEAANKLL